MFPEGVHGRREAIQHRLQNAGLKRKIGKNQTTHICAILTGSPEQMAKIVEEGKLDEWCQENLKSLYKMFGRENVVSCVLHMDEKTPHLHATIIPIVNTPRKRREREGKAKFNVNSDGPRLSCDEVMSRANLAKDQDIYGEDMKPFGVAYQHGASRGRRIWRSFPFIWRICLCPFCSFPYIRDGSGKRVRSQCIRIVISLPISDPINRLRLG